MIKLFRCALITVLLALPASFAYAKPVKSGKLSKAAQHAADIRLKKIRHELATAHNPGWAGEYYYRLGLGDVSLAVAPNSGFVFTERGCLSLCVLNYGQVDFSGNTLRLLFTYSYQRKSFKGIPPSGFIPVQWGQRHYLIPADAVIEFANAVNEGTEPLPWDGRSHQFLLKRGDENKFVEGKPPLPEPYRAYLLEKPVHARIISVGENRVEGSIRLTSVILDAGEADGVKKGMELYVCHPSDTFGEATIVSLQEKTAQAVLKQFTHSVTPSLSNTASPSIGWQVSTELIEKLPFERIKNRHWVPISSIPLTTGCNSL